MPPVSGKKKPVKAPPKAKAPPKYPEVKATVHSKTNPITVGLAKDLLGWEEEKEESPFGADFLFHDLDGGKIRCTNNLNNRPFYKGVCEALVQELLQKRWRLNGEAIIISRSGQVLNGQHTLAALVWAEQMRVGAQADHWSEMGWVSPVVMEKVIVYGIPDDDDILNTMDTCRPRSLADVIYRSPFFSKFGTEKRYKASQRLSGAINVMWSRTGIKKDPFAPHQSHTEAVDFVERHPRLLQCVNHIMEEDTERSISGYIPGGTASAWLYLMAACDSDGDEYRRQMTPSEKQVSFGKDNANWDSACLFWTKFGTHAEELSPVFEALSGLNDPETGKVDRSGTGAIIARAWNVYKDGGEITEEDLKLEYNIIKRKDKEGNVKSERRVLMDPPDIGGIDMVPTSEVAGDDVVEEVEEEGDEEISPEELEERREAEKLKSLEATRDAKRKADKEKLLAGRSKGKGNGEAKPRPQTRKEIMAENTRKAAEADALMESREPDEDDEEGEPDEQE